MAELLGKPQYIINRVININTLFSNVQNMVENNCYECERGLRMAE